MSKFDKVEIGTKIIITNEGARVLSKWFELGQIGYFEGFKNASDDIIRVRVSNWKELRYYSDTFWRVYTRPS